MNMKDTKKNDYNGATNSLLQQASKEIRGALNLINVGHPFDRPFLDPNRRKDAPWSQFPYPTVKPYNPNDDCGGLWPKKDREEFERKIKETLTASFKHIKVPNNAKFTETEEEYTLFYNLAGYSKENVKITMNGSTLKIEGTQGGFTGQDTIEVTATAPEFNLIGPLKVSLREGVLRITANKIKPHSFTLKIE